MRPAGRPAACSALERFTGFIYSKPSPLMRRLPLARQPGALCRRSWMAHSEATVASGEMGSAVIGAGFCLMGFLRALIGWRQP